MGRFNIALAFGLSALIGGVLLWFAIAELPLKPVQAWFQSADLATVLTASAVYTLLYCGVHGLRIWRWSFLLRPLQTEPNALRAAVRAGSIGFAAILLLPLRLGELVRPYLLSRDTSCSMTAALGTVVVERVFDGLFITLLLFCTLATYTGAEETEFAFSMGLVSLAVFGGALTVCIAAAVSRSWTLSLLRNTAGRVAPNITEKLAGMLETFLDGIGSMRESRSLLPFLIVTTAYWTLNGVSIALFASWGFGLSLGPWQGMTVLAILVVGLMIPTGPGLVGNYQYFLFKGLALFLPKALIQGPGVAFVAAIHILQFIVQIAPGMVALWGSGMSFLKLSKQAQEAATHTTPNP